MSTDPLLAAEQLLRLFGDEAEEMALLRIDTFIAVNDIANTQFWVMARAHIRRINTASATRH